MATDTIFTQGLGNGTFSGTVAEIVTFGYTIGEEVIEPNPWTVQTDSSDTWTVQSESTDTWTVQS